MTDDPFLTLIVESLNLMHPRFARVSPAALAREFYHQFRHLWDKALPVRLGLGHVVIQDDPAITHGWRPDFLIWQLGEHGQPDRRLGAVLFASAEDLAWLAELQPDLAEPSFGPAQHLAWLARLRSDPGYPYAVCVIACREADVPLHKLWAVNGVTFVFFDTDRWQSHVVIATNQEDRS